MKLFQSELDIPELENMPVKEARQILKKSRLEIGRQFNLLQVVILLACVVPVSAFTSSKAWVALAAFFGVAITDQIKIALLRPRIRRLMQT